VRSRDRVFTAYGLPLPPRRQGPAALLSLLAHLGIAVAVLWRGAAMLEGGGGGSGPRGGGGGRPAISWFALPPMSSPQARDVPAAPAVTVPLVALPIPQLERIAVPVEPILVAPPPSPTTTTAPVGTGDGTTGGPGSGAGTGGGQGTGTGTGAGSDQGPGSGGEASYIFPASPRWTIFPPPGAPREARGRRHEVRFWVTAEGRVTRVEVTPPIKDSGYRREFIERMMGYLFNPATTRDGRRVDYIASVTVIP
jgi:hypothetical protein